MEFEQAARVLDGIPYTSPEKGRIFYDLVTATRPRRILELGFAHGVSTCYFAAAAQELGGCEITAVDLDRSRTYDPSLEQLSARLGLEGIVHIRRELSSYTWFLEKEIEAQTDGHTCHPKYDLIFIDGPKDWTNDGCAFFLADKLLRPEGTMMFDDYAWTYRTDEATRGKKHHHGYVFDEMSDEEFEKSHVEAIFRLLVMQHPSYGDFKIVDDQLAIARKTSAVAHKQLRIESRLSLKYRVVTTLKKLVKLARDGRPRATS